MPIEILPRPSSILRDTAFIDESFGYRAVIEEFKKKGLHGILLRGKRMFNHGCIFVPSDSVNGIVIIKSLSSVDEKSVQNIGKPILEQLEWLNNRKVVDCNFHIRLCILAKKQNLSEEICKEVSKLVISKEGRFPNLVLESNSEKLVSIESLSEKPAESSRDIRCKTLLSLIKEFRENSAEYRLNNLPFTAFNERDCTFKDTQKVLAMFDSYFPQNLDRLEIIPHPDCIEDNLLNKTKSEVVPDTISSKFEGEVAEFFNLLRLFEKDHRAHGVFVKDVSSEIFDQHLQPLCDSISIEFQFDWLFCGIKGLFLFECSYSQNSDNPEQSIINKITQVVTKHLPMLEILLIAISKSNEALDLTNDDLRTILNEHLSVVIFLPNVGCNAAVKTWEDVKSKLDERVINSLQTGNARSRIKFLFKSEQSDGSVYDLNSIGESLQLLPEPFKIEDFVYETTEQEYNLPLKWAMTIFSLSVLKLNMSEAKQNKKFLTNRDRFGENKNPLNFFISPQQKRILDENRPFVILAGQHGCGKTSVLMAKAEIEARKESVKKILYFIPEEKEPFYKYLHETKTCFGSELLNAKTELVFLRLKRDILSEERQLKQKRHPESIHKLLHYHKNQILHLINNKKDLVNPKR